MAENLLSQEDMDRLLQEAEGYAVPSTDTAPSSEGVAIPSRSEQDISIVVSEAVAEQMQRSLSFGIQQLGSALSRKAEVGRPLPETISAEVLYKRYADNFIAIIQEVSGFASGSLAIIISRADAMAITAISGKSAEELASQQTRILQSLFAPIWTALCNSLTPAISDDIHIGKLEVKEIKLDSSLFTARKWLKLQMPLRLEGGIDAAVHLILPTEMASEIYRKIQEKDLSVDIAIPPEDDIAPGQLGIKEIHFPTMQEPEQQSSSQPNINLLMDVQMTLTVELGRTKMYIKEILGLGEGSIIELDKLAGEPVDLLVSGKLIAKGEVVVIDENFGVRVTDIVSPVDRIGQFSSESE